MTDILEKAKMLYGEHPVVRELIAEVERLDAQLKNQYTNMNKEIESLQSQLDELRIVSKNHETNRWENFDLAQERRLKLEAVTKERDELNDALLEIDTAAIKMVAKLEAENATLQTKISNQEITNIGFAEKIDLLKVALTASEKKVEELEELKRQKENCSFCGPVRPA